MTTSVHAYYYLDDSEPPARKARHRLTSHGDDSSSPGVNLDYVAEGAANVIWSLTTEPALRKKLLRIRKGTWAREGEPPAKGRPPPFLSSSKVLDLYDASTRPLFEPGQLVEQELVEIDPELITQCNTRLDELEQRNDRPPARHHWHLKHGETYGLLITSMLPTSARSALFHFKPKWLAQSPTAPPNARRCRTCALAAKRGTAIERLLCPLALYSGEKATVRQQIEARVRAEATMSKDMIGRRPSITEGVDGSGRMLKAEASHSLIEDFTNLFVSGQQAHKLLTQLKTLQTRFDPNGVLNLASGGNASDVSMAMTLRDATMFVKLTPDGADVRLGDLDPKSGDDERKVQEWRDTEDSLIKEGWYTGTEDATVRKGMGIHTSCFLWTR